MNAIDAEPCARDSCVVLVVLYAFAALPRRLAQGDHGIEMPFVRLNVAGRQKEIVSRYQP